MSNLVNGIKCFNDILTDNKKDLNRGRYSEVCWEYSLTENIRKAENSYKATTIHHKKDVQEIVQNRNQDEQLQNVTNIGNSEGKMANRKRKKNKHREICFRIWMGELLWQRKEQVLIG